MFSVYRKSNEGWLIDMVHKCGELVQVESNTQRVIRYRSAFGSVITQCPHCLKDIEWEDLQSTGMVDELGWHE